MGVGRFLEIFGRSVERRGEEMTAVLRPWASEDGQNWLLGLGIGIPLAVYEASKVLQAFAYCQTSRELCNAGIHALLRFP